MAIRFDANAASGYGLYRSGASGLPTTASAPWTLSLWYRPKDTSTGQRNLIAFGTLATGLMIRGSNQTSTAWLDTFPSTLPWAGSASTSLTWNSAASTRGTWIAWRYDGTAYDKWIDGTRTSISASIAITVPTYSGITVGSNGTIAAGTPTRAGINGALAEVAIWTTALSGAEMAMLQRGVAADQLRQSALVDYWPLRGVSTTTTLPEPNYATAARDLTLYRTHAAAEVRIEHPTIYSPPTTAYSFPAWVLKLGGTDAAPTYTAASTALSSAVDYEVLGCTPPQAIADVDTVVVTQQLSDPQYGIVLPSTVTVNLHNADYRSHAACVAPDRIGGGMTGRDPVAFWRMSSPSESGVETTRETMSGMTATKTGTVTLNDTGGLVGDSSTCMTFGGGVLTANMPAALSLAGSFSFAAWFKSASTTQSLRYVMNSNPSNQYPLLYGYDARSGQILTLSGVAVAGSGYVVGDILTLGTGTGGTVRVVAVNAGAVLGVELVTAGYSYAAATSYATSGGSGSSCQVTVGTVNSTPRALVRWHGLNNAALHVDVPDTGWHHVAWTYDGTIGRAYLDGALVGSATMANSNGAGGTQIYFGAVDTGFGQYFSGSMQDVAFWQLTLTSSEISTLYKAGAGLLGYPPGRTWIDLPARLYRYDVQTHEYVAELAGMVAGAEFETGNAAITIQDYDPGVFNTLLPRQTITVDQFPSGDLGAPIPVPFGRATYSPPQCGEDLVGNPGGRDFLLGHHTEASTYSLYTSLAAAYYDQDDSPGLESIVGWEAAPGSPTRASATTYTVTGDQSATYLPGSLMRFGQSAAVVQGEWAYARVDSYSSGTVTVSNISRNYSISSTATSGYVTEIANAPVVGGTGYTVGDVLTLGGGTAATAIVVQVSSGVVTEVRLVKPGYSYATGTKATTGGTGSGCTVQVVSVSGPQIAALDAMLFERTRYAVGSRNLNSMRLVGNTDAAGVVATVINSYAWGGTTDIRNPATVLSQILSDAAWGLSLTVDAGTLATAQSALYSANLGAAINGALGGDRQQRAAGDVLNELLMMRGMRLVRLVDDSWSIIVDTAPTTWTTLEVGGAVNNVVSLGRRQRTPATEAVSALEVRYGLRGRFASTTDYKHTFQPTNDYMYSVLATAQSYGGQRSIVLPWVQTHAVAARVAQYLARRMRYAEETIEVTVASVIGRWLTLGDGVQLRSAADGIDGTYRVRSISRGLVRTVLLLESYDARLFAAYDSSEIGYEYDSTGALQQADYEPDLDTLLTPGDGANLIANCDFSVPPSDSTTLPGFWVNAADRNWTMSVDYDVRYVGGSALTVATTNGELTADLVPLGSLAASETAVSTPVVPGDAYVFSFYADDRAGVKVAFVLNDSATVSIDWFYAELRKLVGEQNAFGWSRYYAFVRVPEPWIEASALQTPATLGVFLECVSDGTSYSFDALQLEKVGQRTHKPTPWKRHPRWGVDPAAITPGDLTIRADGTLTSGTRAGILELTMTNYAFGVWATEEITGKYILGVTAKVTSTIVATGATKWRLGSLLQANEEMWGANLSLTAGTTTTKDNWSLYWSPQYTPSPERVTAEALDGSDVHKDITAGTIVVRVHYLEVVD